MTAIVTGGSKGIGRGVARRLADDGHDVVIAWARDHEAAVSAEAVLRETGRDVVAVRADIGTEEGCREVGAAVRAVTDGGPLHVVHAAVDARRSSAESLTDDVLHRAVDVNALPLVRLAATLRPEMRAGSTITLLSSQGPRTVVAGYASVAATKAAAETLVRYLAVELAPDGIRVNTLVSGPVLTDALRQVFPDADQWFDRLAARVPAGRAVTPDDVAGAVAFLASDDAAMITGQALVVDGGAGLSAG